MQRGFLWVSGEPPRPPVRPGGCPVCDPVSLRSVAPPARKSNSQDLWIGVSCDLLIAC